MWRPTARVVDIIEKKPQKVQDVGCNLILCISIYETERQGGDIKGSFRKAEFSFIRVCIQRLFHPRGETICRLGNWREDCVEITLPANKTIKDLL
jgi:hypothetical protein